MRNPLEAYIVHIGERLLKAEARVAELEKLLQTPTHYMLDTENEFYSGVLWQTPSEFFENVDEDGHAVNNVLVFQQIRVLNDVWVVCHDAENDDEPTTVIYNSRDEAHAASVEFMKKHNLKWYYPTV